MSKVQETKSVDGGNKLYKIKVQGWNTAFVKVEADNEEEAKELAEMEASFDSVESCQVLYYCNKEDNNENA